MSGRIPQIIEEMTNSLPASDSDSEIEGVEVRDMAAPSTSSNVPGSHVPHQDSQPTWEDLVTLKWDIDDTLNEMFGITPIDVAERIHILHHLQCQNREMEQKVAFLTWQRQELLNQSVRATAMTLPWPCLSLPGTSSSSYSNPLYQGGMPNYMTDQREPETVSLVGDEVNMRDEENVTLIDVNMREEDSIQEVSVQEEVGTGIQEEVFENITVKEENYEGIANGGQRGGRGRRRRNRGWSRSKGRKK